MIDSATAGFISVSIFRDWDTFEPIRLGDRTSAPAWVFGIIGATVPSRADVPSGGEVIPGTEINIGSDVRAGTDTIDGLAVKSGADVTSGTDVTSVADITSGANEAIGAVVTSGANEANGAGAPSVDDEANDVTDKDNGADITSGADVTSGVDVTSGAIVTSGAEGIPVAEVNVWEASSKFLENWASSQPVGFNPRFRISRREDIFPNKLNKLSSSFEIKTKTWNFSWPIFVFDYI